MLEVLLRLPAAHVLFKLLRNSLDGCKINYLTRCSNLEHVRRELKQATSLLRNTLGDILAGQLSNKQWAQASLPVRLGGLGISDPSEVAFPARMACSVEFIHRSAEFGVPAEVPLVPPDFLGSVAEVRAVVGPEVDPLATWAADPLAI